MGTGEGGVNRSLFIIAAGCDADDVGVKVLGRVASDGDLDRRVVVPFVIADHEPERFEEGPELVVGGVEEVRV
ncbi:MAG: hypothetical protein M0005_07175 [Actinomycetota bacterium]|nr:hypothetical protein [Actinomycetota bacterium]